MLKLYRSDDVIFKPGKYQIRIEKSHRKYLKKPYTSNCSPDDKDVFSSEYTKDGCEQTCILRSMLKDCGTVVDAWKKYIPTEQWNKSESALQNYIANKNVTVEQCLAAHLPNFKAGQKKKNAASQCVNVCPKACEEIRWEKSIDRQDRCKKSPIGYWQFEFKFKSDFVSVHQEVPKYPMQSFLSEIGGIIGLLVGMSTMSLVEILVYAAMSVYSLFVTKKVVVTKAST